MQILEDYEEFGPTVSYTDEEVVNHTYICKVVNYLYYYTGLCERFNNKI